MELAGCSELAGAGGDARGGRTFGVEPLRQEERVVVLVPVEGLQDRRLGAAFRSAGQEGREQVCE